MATKKTYTIEIQLDNARNQLADAIKKLGELDAQMEGLEAGGEKAKALTAEMAKLAGEIEGLQDGIKGFGEELDSLKPGTVGALGKELEELEAAFKATTLGTKEQEQALLALGRKKAEIKSLEDQVDALNEQAKAGAFVDMANGIAGVVGVGLAAAESLGLSAQSAEEYEKKMQTVIAVTGSLEAIQKALNSESRANIKNLLATAKAYITGGEAATQGGKAARIAIASTGIGLLVVALGLVVANWDKLTKTVTGSKGEVTKFGEVSSGVWAAFKKDMSLAAEGVKKLFTGDFEGLGQVWRSRGVELAKAFEEGAQEYRFSKYKERLAQEVEYNALVLDVAKAQGKDTFALEEKLLKDKFVLLSRGNEEEKKQSQEVARDLAVLRAGQAKKEREDALAATLARINAVAALEQARGNDNFKQQMQARQVELNALLAAVQRNEAAIIAKRGEIRALEAAHEVQQAEKKRAAVEKAGQDEIAILAAQGKETIDLRVKLAQELLALDTGTSEKAQEQRKADLAALRLVLAEQAAYEKNIQQEQADQRAEYDALDVENRAAFTAAVSAEGDRLLAKQAALKKTTGDLGSDILINFFGVAPDKVAGVKAAIEQSVAMLYSSLMQLGAALNEAAIQEADAQIQSAQARLQELDQQLQERQSNIERITSDLAGAEGSRREYLVQRLAKERAETTRLAAEKAKAARAEETATKKRHQLEKEGQVIAAATALATNTATAAAAVYAGVRAISGAAEVPFPGSIVAIVAALAAVIGAVASAKSLSSAVKMADGGVIQGGSHASGNDVPVFGGRVRVEGGEMITPVDATQNNFALLERIRTLGRSKTLTAFDLADLPQVLPPPVSYRSGPYADGGPLPSAAQSGGLASAADLSSLRAEAQQTNALLAQVAAHSASTARSSAATAAKPPIGREGALELRSMAAEVDAAEAARTL